MQIDPKLKELHAKLAETWNLCNDDREIFRKYLQTDALAFRNLNWLFRHELTRKYLEDVLSDLKGEENKIAQGCIARMKDLFNLDINTNDDGDPDMLCDFTQACRSLLAEARADLHREGKNFDISFAPLELYLADLEIGTFGFYPVEYDGGSDDGIASWQR